MQFIHHIQAKNLATHKSKIGTYGGGRDSLVPRNETVLNPLKYHINKWMKEDKKDHDLITITNVPRGINVKKHKCSH